RPEHGLSIDANTHASLPFELPCTPTYATLNVCQAQQALGTGNSDGECLSSVTGIVGAAGASERCGRGIGIADHEEQALAFVGALAIEHRHLVTDLRGEVKVVAAVIADDLPAD